jgi:hypothetical protein
MSLPTTLNLNPQNYTLLAVHDHIIKAMGHQKVTALRLLDLSAALIPLITRFFIVFRPSFTILVSSTALSCINLNVTLLLHLLRLMLTNLFLLSFLFYLVFLRALSRVPYFLFFTLHSLLIPLSLCGLHSTSFLSCLFRCKYPLLYLKSLPG